MIAVFASRSDLSIRLGDEVSMLIRESAERKKDRQKGGFFGVAALVAIPVARDNMPDNGRMCLQVAGIGPNG